jgi:hypothetical protein
MAALNWDEEKYWRVRDRLFDEGKLVLGRGRGGSVARVVAVPVPPIQSASASRAILDATGSPMPVNTESDLYEPLLATLQAQWSRFRRLDNFLAAITANQGRRQTNGTWTRPDITGISVRRYAHVQGVHFDLWTFEIKPSWQVNVTGVFEAAAHSKFATRPFVMFNVPEDEEPSELSRCIEEATS